MTARLVSLFSGSSGNCTAINCGGDTILIDAGRSAKAIEEQLAVVGIDPGTLRAIFVTHEHTDQKAPGAGICVRRHGGSFAMLCLPSRAAV